MSSKDRDRVLHEYSNKWLKEQLKLKKKLITYDDFHFELQSTNLNDINRNKNTSINPNACLSSLDMINNLLHFVSDNNINNEQKSSKPFLKYVAGVDISRAPNDEDLACAGICILEYPSMREVYKEFQIVRYCQPYIPGFLAFREVKFLMDIIATMKNNAAKFMPDVILVDGNGVWHHRGFGLASHLGVLCDIPTIGVSKNVLAVHGLSKKLVMDQYRNEVKCRGQYSTIYAVNNVDNIPLGVALRCGFQALNPVFISVGHRISLQTAIKIVLECSKYKIPEPIRAADLGTRKAVKAYEQSL